VALAMAEHEPLVHWVVHRQWLGGVAYREAVQVGRIALWRAVCGYDPARGVRFSSYAVPAIARAVWRAVAQAGAEPGAESWETAPAVEPDLEGRLDALASQTLLAELVAQLPDRLRQVIVAHYGLCGHDPQSFPQIAGTLGVTRQRVQQLHVEALLWLADPAHSARLRQRLERNTQHEYRLFLARRRAWQRSRRSGR
jgi:RNA polymerase sigma factor (sigma-70 family)